MYNSKRNYIIGDSQDAYEPGSLRYHAAAKLFTSHPEHKRVFELWKNPENPIPHNYSDGNEMLRTLFPDMSDVFYVTVWSAYCRKREEFCGE